VIAPFPEDVLHERDMVEGSHMLLRAINHYQYRQRLGLPQVSLPGGRFRWRGHTSGSDASYQVYQRSEALTRAQLKIERAETLRTIRDPCTYCGTRADYGCDHRGAI
jgi:hypothetical protein